MPAVCGGRWMYGVRSRTTGVWQMSLNFASRPTGLLLPVDKCRGSRILRKRWGLRNFSATLNKARWVLFTHHDWSTVVDVQASLRGMTNVLDLYSCLRTKMSGDILLRMRKGLGKVVERLQHQKFDTVCEPHLPAACFHPGLVITSPPRPRTISSEWYDTLVITRHYDAANYETCFL